MVSSLSDIQELPQKCCPGGAPGCSQPHLLLRAPGKVNNGFALPHPEHLVQLCIIPSLVPWECHWLPHRPRDPTPPRSCSHPSHSPIPDHLTRCLWLWEGTETAPVQTSLHFCCSGSSVLNSTASRHEVPKQHQGDVCKMLHQYPDLCHLQRNGPNLGNLSCQSHTEGLLRDSSAIQRCSWNGECFHPCSQQVQQHWAPVGLRHWCRCQHRCPSADTNTL